MRAVGSGFSLFTCKNRVASLRESLLRGNPRHRTRSKRKMSGKRTKQYLMLLMVVGLVSIAAGGGGTFASFSAETANTGNYFATGTLILNDNGGVNTCTSAVDSGNSNTTGTDCDTLFATPQIAVPHAVLSTALTLTPTTSLTFSAGLVGAAIAKGDTLTVTDPTGVHTDTFTATQAVLAGVGVSSQ